MAVTATTLLNAGCLQALDLRQDYLQAYLALSIAGESTDPNTVAASVACWDKLSMRQLEEIITERLSVIQSNINNSPDSVAAYTACYEAISPQLANWLQTYLLCFWNSSGAPGDCTPLLDDMGNPVLDAEGRIICT